MIRRRGPLVLWGNVIVCRLCLEPLRNDQDGDAHPECLELEAGYGELDDLYRRLDKLEGDP